MSTSPDDLNLKMVMRYQDDAAPGVQQTSQQLKTLQQQNDVLNKMTLDAQRQRMTDQEKLLSDYQQKAAKINQMELASEQQKNQALGEIQKTYQQQSLGLLNQQQAGLQQYGQSLLTNRSQIAQTAAAYGPYVAAIAAVVAVFEIAKTAAEKFLEITRQMVERSAQLGTEMEKASLQTRMSTQELSAMKYAAEQNEGSLDMMISATRFLSRAMVEAGQGNKDVQEIFKRYGVTADEMRQKTPVEAFVLLAKKMKDSGDQAQFTADSMKLFGRSSQELLPLIRQIDEFESAMKRAKEMGFIVTPEFARQTEAYTNSLNDLKYIMDALSVSAGSALVPALTGLVKVATEWWRTNQEIVRADLRGVYEGIADGIRALTNIIGSDGDVIRDVFHAVAVGIEFTIAGIYQMIATGAKMAADFTNFNAEIISGCIKAANFFGAKINENADWTLKKLRETSAVATSVWVESSKAAIEAAGRAQMMMDGTYAKALEAARQINELLADKGKPGGKTPRGPNEVELKQQEELNKMILESQEAMMNEKEKLQAEYAEKVKAVMAMELVSESAKDNALLQLGKEFRFKMDKLQEEEDKKEEARQMKIYNEARRGYDRMVKENLEASKKADEQFSEMIANMAKDQEKAIKHASEMAQIGLERQEFHIEIDPKISSNLKHLMTDLINAQKEVEKFKTEKALDVFKGDIDAAAVAAERLRLALERLAEAERKLKQPAVERGIEDLTKRMKDWGQIGSGMWEQFNAGIESSAQSWATCQMTFGQAMKQMVADQAAAFAQMAMMNALYATALGFLRLAQWDFAAAAQAFLSAAIWGALAVGARAVSGAMSQSASGGGKTAGGSEARQVGPREYTSADIAKIRAQGGGTSTGGGEGQGNTIIHNHNYFYSNFKSIDSKGMVEVLENHEQNITKIVTSGYMKNGALAQRAGGILTRSF